MLSSAGFRFIRVADSVAAAVDVPMTIVAYNLTKTHKTAYWIHNRLQVTSTDHGLPSDVPILLRDSAADVCQTIVIQVRPVDIPRYKGLSLLSGHSVCHAAKTTPLR